MVLYSIYANAARVQILVTILIFSFYILLRFVVNIRYVCTLPADKCIYIYIRSVEDILVYFFSVIFSALPSKSFFYCITKQWAFASQHRLSVRANIVFGGNRQEPFVFGPEDPACNFNFSLGLRTSVSIIYHFPISISLHIIQMHNICCKCSIPIERHTKHNVVVYSAAGLPASQINSISLFDCFVSIYLQIDSNEIRQECVCVLCV